MKFFISSMLLVLSFNIVFIGNANAFCDERCAIKALYKDGLHEVAVDKKWNVFLHNEILLKNQKINIGPFNQQKTIKVRRESWLVFVDKKPGEGWEHKASIYLIGTAEGCVEKIGVLGYPIIDGVNYFDTKESLDNLSTLPEGFPRFTQQRPLAISNFVAPINFDINLSSTKRLSLKPKDPKDMDQWVTPDSKIPWIKHKKRKDELKEDYERELRGAYEKPQPNKEAASEAGKCECNEESQKKFALYINGHGNPGEKYSTKGMLGFLKKSSYDSTSVIPHLQSPQPKNQKLATKQNVIAAFDELAGKVSSCCDEVLIVLAGHGSPRGYININTEGVGTVKGQKVPYGHKDGFNMHTSFIKKQLDKIKSCKVKVVIMSCYAGAHLEKGLNKITKKNMGEGCMCRTVYVSSSARQTSSMSDGNAYAEKLEKSKGDITKSFLDFKKLTDTLKDLFKNPLSNQNPQIQSTDCILCDDPDEDGILTWEELKDSYSDPLVGDTDKDGLSDGIEKKIKSNPRKKNSDKDRLSDAEEYELGTDPSNEDTDGDGFRDDFEVGWGTDPKKRDTDGDGMDDLDEIRAGRDPLKKDGND